MTDCHAQLMPSYFREPSVNLGDMVRVGGLTYTCEPGAKMGSRIQNRRLKGQLIEASKNAGPLAWGLVESYLRAKKIIKPPKLNVLTLVGVAGNPGLA